MSLNNRIDYSVDMNYVIEKLSSLVDVIITDEVCEKTSTFVMSTAKLNHVKELSSKQIMDYCIIKPIKELVQINKLSSITIKSIKAVTYLDTTIPISDENGNLNHYALKLHEHDYEKDYYVCLSHNLRMKIEDRDKFKPITKTSKLLFNDTIERINEK